MAAGDMQRRLGEAAALKRGDKRSEGSTLTSRY